MQNDIFINISWQGYGGSILSQFEGTSQIELFRKAAQFIQNSNLQADMPPRTNCHNQFVHFLEFILNTTVHDKGYSSLAKIGQITS